MLLLDSRSSWACVHLKTMRWRRGAGALPTAHAKNMHAPEARVREKVRRNRHEHLCDEYTGQGVREGGGGNVVSMHGACVETACFDDSDG